MVKRDEYIHSYRKQFLREFASELIALTGISDRDRRKIPKLVDEYADKFKDLDRADFEENPPDEEHAERRRQ